MAVYFDYNATTPILPEVTAAMEPFLHGLQGNVSSSHSFGQEARLVVDRARTQVAEALHAKPGEVVFLSGGTESIQTALSLLLSPHFQVLITSSVEHAAIRDMLPFLAGHGEVVVLPPDESGRVLASSVEEALAKVDGSKTLVSIQEANNETGVIQPLTEIAEVCHAHGARVHSDAVQSFGKRTLNTDALGVDYLSLAGHKAGGPTGVGVLFVREDAPYQPFAPGSQEDKRRGGTHNLAGIVGMGEAAVHSTRSTKAFIESASAQVEFEQAITGGVKHARVTSQNVARLTNTTHLTFDPEVGPDLVMTLDLMGFATSAGSACASGSPEPSHVLLAMGIEAERARTSLRVSWGPNPDPGELRALSEALIRLTNQV